MNHGYNNYSNLPIYTSTTFSKNKEKRDWPLYIVIICLIVCLLSIGFYMIISGLRFTELYSKIRQLEELSYFNVQYPIGLYDNMKYDIRRLKELIYKIQRLEKSYDMLSQSVSELYKNITKN